MVATKGMLSTKAEAIAESHSISRPVGTMAPPVSSRDFLATDSIMPTCSRPPTITNNPAKKKITGHSTAARACSGSSLVSRSSRLAPARATVADSRWRYWCSTKPTTVTTMAKRHFFNKTGSFICSLAFIFIMLFCSSGFVLSCFW